MDTVGESMDAMGAVMNGNVNQKKKKISLGAGKRSGSEKSVLPA